MKALWIAFSMYSRLPVPQFEWEEHDRKKAMYFFPFVGAVVGCCFMTVCFLMRRIGAGPALSGAALTAVPLLVTGGIHMDGFLDTCDARSSFAGREKRLEILKDTHTGAFAVLYGGLYLIVYYAACEELAARGYLPANAGSGVLAAGGSFTKAIQVISAGFVLSRSLSGLAASVLPEARKQGMLADFMKDVDKRRLASVMLAYAAVCGVFMGMAGGACGILAAFAAGVAFFLFCRMAVREFGGITGDLAGYFLQLCELLILLAASLGIGIFG